MCERLSTGARAAVADPLDYVVHTEHVQAGPYRVTVSQASPAQLRRSLPTAGRSRIDGPQGEGTADASA
ncbi:hypothetical protein [Mycobacterium sp. AT1]|uniref:hypothetical protein n=1 Tax=Mycobacterium sp. AT1 TaxID=1961706 RepID=UPI00114D54BB|nr:hypothetical protein [Mycobacterium sp. AT1]